MTGHDNPPRAAWRITIDGEELASAASRRLIDLTHTDNRGFEADTLEITLDDADGALALPPRGAVLALELGWAHSGLVNKGEFTVDEVAHNGAPDTLSIRARSGDLAAGLTTQRERSWHDTTLGAIVRTIARENDLKAVIPIKLSEIEIPHLDQTNESSANFLTRVAEMFDAMASIKSGRLLFMHAGSGRTASGQRIPAVTITRQNGDRHQFTLADRNSYKAVRALYHDINGAVKGEVTWGDEEHAIEAGKRPEPAPAPTAPTGQYKTLPQTLSSRPKAQRAARKEWERLKKNRAQKAAYIGVRASYNDKALGASGTVQWGAADDQAQAKAAAKTARKDQLKIDGQPVPTTPAEPVNAFERTADNVKTLRHVYASKANALRAARAEWRRLKRGMASFSLTLALGIPELQVERPATIRGWKPQIDSTDWIITRVVNNLSGDGGYTQRLEFEIRATELPD